MFRDQWRKRRVWERKGTNGRRGGGDLSKTMKQERGKIVENRR